MTEKLNNHRQDDLTATIGILVKRFPKLSETFILGEMLGLERAGFRLRIYSLYPPSDNITHPLCKKLQAPILYCPTAQNINFFTTVRTHLTACLLNPVRYIQALFNCRAKQSKTKNSFSIAAWLAQDMLKNNVGHLHSHFINEPASIAHCAHLLTGLPFSLSAHAKDIYLSPKKELSRKLRAACFTVTCTEYNRSYLQLLVPENHSVYCMYHGVDFDRLQNDKVSNLPQASTAARPLPLILSIGRLREKKGFHLLIQACQLLKNSGTAFRCQIVGYGPDQGKLEKQIKQAGLQQTITLRGKLNHPEVIKLFRQAELFVLPCIIGSDGDRDGIPNVILEALAMKVPVVTTPISGIPEIIKHRQTGILVAQGNIDELAVSISELLNNAELRTSLSSNGYKTVQQQFCNETNLKLLQQLLKQSTSGKSLFGYSPQTGLSLP